MPVQQGPITPKGKPGKSAVARLILWFLGRGICACAGVDSRIQTEVGAWTEGTRVMLKVDPAGPAMLIAKEGGRLRFLGLREEPDATLSIYFKHLEAALLVLTGQISIPQAYAQRRITLRGDLTFALSVVRVMQVVEAYLFPRLITARIMQRVPTREVSVLRIYLSTLFAAHGA